VPAFDEQVRGRHHPAVRHPDDGGVVSRPEIYCRSLRQTLSYTSDKSKFAQITDCDSPHLREDTVRWPTDGTNYAREDVMVQAYILIQTEVGKAADVAHEISGIFGVTKAEDVTGPYDVIVRAEANNVDDLGKLVVAQIQAVQGITRTLTCPIVHI
jgi:DNA-binding Lrp family transcriptional regulator